MLLSRLYFFGLISLGIGCTSNVESFSDVVQVDEADATANPVAHKSSAELVDYEFKGAKGKVESVTCLVKKAQGTVLLVNRDDAPIGGAAFCTGWLGQTFLKRGYNVLAVNRPGFGQSTGDNDLSGPMSTAALKAAASQFRKTNPDETIVGAWGFGSGAIAAAVFGRSEKPVDWLILGNGIYDAELVSKQTKDVALKGIFEKIVAGEGASAFDKRSVAWDFEGLPKNIFIYHGKDDHVVPVKQAKSFRDTLEAQEHNVRLLVLEKVGHDIPSGLHGGVIKTILTEDVAKLKRTGGT